MKELLTHEILGILLINDYCYFFLILADNCIQFLLFPKLLSLLSNFKWSIFQIVFSPYFKFKISILTFCGLQSFGEN